MTATQADTSDSQTLAEWLGARTDAELVELLRIRPDLTVPVPQSMQVLAGRVAQRASVQRCADELDTVALSVIEALALIGADKVAVPVTRLRNAMSGRASKAVVDEAVAALRARALVWGSRSLRLVPAAVDAVPWPVGRAEQRAEMSEEDILAALVGDRPRRADAVGAARRDRPDRAHPRRGARERPPIGLCSGCSRSGCCAGSTTRPSSCHMRWGRCCAGRRSPIPARSPRRRPNRCGCPGPR